MNLKSKTTSFETAYPKVSLKIIYLMALVFYLNAGFAAESPEASEETTCNAVSSLEAYYPQGGFSWDDVEFEYEDEIMPTPGSVVAGVCDFVTPKFTVESTDSTLVKGTKTVANEFLKEGTKYALTVTGGSTVKRAYRVYGETDLTKGEGSLARNFGDGLKPVVESLPFVGPYIVDAAQALKPEGTKTLAEAVGRVICPATETKIEGTTGEVLGSFAKSAVISYVPFGNQVVKATGAIAKATFGTETLTHGLYNWWTGAQASADSPEAENSQEETEDTQ